MHHSLYCPVYAPTISLFLSLPPLSFALFLSLSLQDSLCSNSVFIRRVVTKAISIETDVLAC